MLDYIYMNNLPIYLYVLYYVFGVSLNVISYNIAINKFNTKKIPFFVMFLMFLIANVFILILLPLLNFHVGVYLLISIVIPYAAVWRSDF